jgi:hypothetical protein
MHIGVPTGGQGHFQTVGQPGAQHPELAGTGDVDQVGFEALQNFADQRNMADKRRIETQVFFQCKR